MSSHSMSMCVIPTLVTEGRVDHHRRRDDLAHVALDLRTFHAVEG
jgi:hypothetical protein